MPKDDLFKSNIQEYTKNDMKDAHDAGCDVGFNEGYDKGFRAGTKFGMKEKQKEFLSKKHTGMKISIDGILNRIHAGRKVDNGIGYSCQELLKHLHELAHDFYGGNVSIVDEFLQLYCLDEKRPKVNN